MTPARVVAVASIFGLSGLVPLPLAATLSGGTIVGVVTTGEPSRPPLRITTDPDVCGETLPDESIARDQAGHVAGVVVTAAGVPAQAPPEAVLRNETCRFVPRISLVRPRGVVRMSSKDRVMHTVHAANMDHRALFNLSLPIPDVVISRPIDKPGIVTLSCSTHTWMRGSLFVTEELSGISAPDGTFRLEGVPAGARELRIWHEALTAAPVRVTVRDGETTRVDVKLVKTGSAS